MPFDWRGFLIVAHGLRNDPSEGVQRTCLGRAYYYVYNVSLANARAMRFTGKMPSLHQQLWNWCQKHADPNIKQIGVNGLRMHALRIDADYKESPIPNLAREVTIQLSRAQAIESLIARINGQTPPTALIP